MKIKGIKKAIGDLNHCPSGWGMLLGLNLKTLKIYSSDICTQNTFWATSEPYELNLGFFTGGSETMKSLEEKIIEEICWRSDNYNYPEEWRDYANQALKKLNA